MLITKSVEHGSLQVLCLLESAGQATTNSTGQAEKVRLLKPLVKSSTLVALLVIYGILKTVVFCTGRYCNQLPIRNQFVQLSEEYF